MEEEYLNIEAKKILDKVSKNVARIRKENNYSQLKLAVELGFKSTSYIGRAELRTNEQHFNIANLVKIAKILDVDICEFFK